MYTCVMAFKLYLFLQVSDMSYKEKRVKKNLNYFTPQIVAAFHFHLYVSRVSVLNFS